MDEGTLRGGALLPLLSNIVLNESDWELDRCGLRFVRSADDSNIFVKSERSGQQVMNSIRRLMVTASFLLATALMTFACAGSVDSAQDKDVTRALDAVRERAIAGDVVAQFSLGCLMYYGSTDTAQAMEWIRKAAAQQYAPAEFHMGQVYDFGFGVPKSDRQAFEWYRNAAGHGSAAAQRSLGEFYQKGRGDPVNLSEALRWYRRAADGDDLRAQVALGNMYFEGTGVPRDYTSAYVWFTIAAGQTPLEDNRTGILELRNIAAARMTPAAVVEAKRRLSAWKPETWRDGPSNSRTDS
jgi:hypothetical protein